jgi:hypothetical protein
MDLALLIVSLLSLVAGFVLRVKARNCRTDLGKSIRWYQVQYWFMPWKTPDLLTKDGLKLHFTSLALIFLGIVLFAIVKGMPPLL